MKWASKYSGERPVSMIAVLEPSTNTRSEPFDDSGVAFGGICSCVEKLRLAKIKASKDTPAIVIDILKEALISTTGC